MDVITNVNVGTGDIHPIVLATFGVASCFAVIIELENKTCVQLLKLYLYLGGWNDMYYMALRKQIDLVRNHCKIMLNLIGFNMPVKKSNDKNKEAGDDDSPNDYVVDATIIYDRSLNPHTFIIGQYAGREHQMGTNRNDSLLQVIYEFDAILKNFQAFICANARGSPYYTDLLNQVLLNVNSQLYIYDSFLDDNFKTKIDTLLSRVKKTTILYE
ncbi:unnamed protein product [Rotaria sordida]|uniref:Uncharacterized protein n=1 Tax=Rotaria sordida TaxID=392033 RepID=A0A813QM90_9BILA|nr:unnamed protein product [Rotaria sordida]CAF3639828.1 unnamed protein product [Rotaria sordida]